MISLRQDFARDMHGSSEEMKHLEDASVEKAVVRFGRLDDQPYFRKSFLPAYQQAAFDNERLNLRIYCGSDWNYSQHTRNLELRAKTGQRH